ncbi:N-acetylmuramoyl-L-alanine amidase [Lipingzhangella sp. LS1_29]|uniref:N-acetylmuramoyl-L-alanine amidase n=1 Tax=Lipingzhangella rawalii TaxID=2055835 RepID=A0ABU2H2Z7_9ACTN|nr:N-acetylmuramoyl-L-alanine amidase [Lipingzhangella rawalii]MDS1269680.1 N-acetylmuramoyl-L-alanine amidase [Lipingzhangella rawalii]
MVTIRSRNRWGARAPRSRTTTTWTSRVGATVHYSAGPPTQSVRAIQDFHMDGRGWDDIGYNFLVDREGRAYEGRGWLVTGAHASGFNTSHIGVCFIGSDGEATAAARSTIRALYDEACRRSGRHLDQTWHGGLPGQSTACPGSDLRVWVQSGMPADGGGVGGEEMLVGLSKGDRGELVKYLQASITYAGGELPRFGVDGHYGDETAEALRQVRASVGSEAKPGWGDTVTGYGAAQLHRAVARAEAGR